MAAPDSGSSEDPPPSSTTWNNLKEDLLKSLCAQQLEHQLRIESMLTLQTQKLLNLYMQSPCPGTVRTDHELELSDKFAQNAQAFPWSQEQRKDSRVAFEVAKGEEEPLDRRVNRLISDAETLVTGVECSTGSSQDIDPKPPPSFLPAAPPDSESISLNQLPRTNDTDNCSDTSVEQIEAPIGPRRASTLSISEIMNMNRPSPIDGSSSTHRRRSSEPFMQAEKSDPLSSPSSSSWKPRKTKADWQKKAYLSSKRRTMTNDRLAAPRDSVQSVSSAASTKSSSQGRRFSLSSVMQFMQVNEKNKVRKTTAVEAQELQQVIVGAALGAVEQGDTEHLSTIIIQGVNVDIAGVIVRAVARVGNIDMLEMLKDHRLWEPGSAEGTKAVIEGAVVGGQLPALLKCYNLPLDKYPHIANDFVLLLRRYPHLRASILAQPSLHFLLASFIGVPGSAAEDLLDMITEEFLGVSVHRDDPEDTRKTQRRPALDVSMSQDFEDTTEATQTEIDALRQVAQVSQKEVQVDNEMAARLSEASTQSEVFQSEVSETAQVELTKMKSSPAGSQFQRSRGSTQSQGFGGTMGALMFTTKLRSMATTRLTRREPDQTAKKEPVAAKRQFKSKNGMAWVPIQHDFPETLFPIYVRPEVTESAVHECAWYHPDEEKLCLLLRQGSYAALKTSKEAPVTALDLNDTHIPSRAVRFAYIYGTPDFPIGGFLYVDGDGKLLAINSISFKKRRHVFWFGKYQKLDKAVSDSLRERSYPCTQGTALWKAGARRYCWVGPPEGGAEASSQPGPGGLARIASVRTDASFSSSGELFCSGESHQLASHQGGFAYIFEDESMNRFFPIGGAAETIDRACVTTGMNAYCLGTNPTGDELLERVVRVSDSHRSQASLPVMLRRLTMPGTTHIAVLHSLATTPRSEVFETLAAKAIIKAAWEKVSPLYFQDLFTEAMRLLAIVYLTFIVRANVEPKNSDVQDVGVASATLQVEMTVSMLLCFAVLFILWVRHVFQEVVKAQAFHKLNWRKDYYDFRFVVEWMDISITGSFLVLLALTHAPASTLLPLLALNGFWRWIKTLDLLRGYDGVGSRVLPIFKALKEIAPFGSVLLFFILGFVHAHYAMSHKDLRYVFLSTYRMGVLAESDMGLDILGVDDEERTSAVQGALLKKALPWSNWQLFLFVLASFVFTVAMMNIFIGIMSQAYHDNMAMAEKLFLRARAALVVTYRVRAHLNLKEYAAEAEDEFVWFCHVDDEH